MSMKGIDRTIADLRKHGDVFAWQDVINYGYRGPYFEQDVRRVTLGDIAERVEADVADILAENARLKAALKPVLEVGWVEKRYNYFSWTVPTKDLYLVVREAQGIYNGGRNEQRERDNR